MSDHEHHFVPWILKQDGYARWEMHPTCTPRYFFVCLECGEGCSFELDDAAGRGLIVLRP